MAEVTNPPPDSVENRHSDHEEKSSSPPRPSTEIQLLSSSPPAKRRERDSRERHDERDLDLPPNCRGGDLNDRNRSSPPPPPRDYKRKPSLSPPPQFRDRRHSPAFRKSPPYKRFRRDDDGRRGSPRGGFVPPDRRYGYDFAGGYEREIVGRPGYAEARPHARNLGHMHQDWDGGRGGYGNVTNGGSAQREGLMSYKQFIQELEDDIIPSEADRRYQEYKSEYISTQKRAFFESHKDELWLKEKYHPTNLVDVLRRRNENARKVAKEFLLELQSGTLDIGPGFTAFSSGKSVETNDPNSEGETDTGARRSRPGRGVPKESDLSAAPKAHPVSSKPRRIKVDVEQAQALVRKLDTERGIQENVLCGSDKDSLSRDNSHGSSTGPVIIIRGLTFVKGLEGVELLDTLVTYLWRVHGLDYYGMIETNEAKGLRHVRAEGKTSHSTLNESEWEEKLDSRWQERVQGQGPLEVMARQEKIEAASAEALDSFVRKIRDEKYGWKYGCGAKGCTKLFHASEFVMKHLKLKHPEVLLEQTSKMREEMYFENYMNDADAPGSQPILQQTLLKDRLLRRGPGQENRFRDERRSRDNRGNDNGRYIGAENPQSDPSSNMVSGGRNGAEPIFDGFGGQGMHGASYSSDLNAPPVLMPVPGAGPLGPFVPAPPEVAMQMFREQGGPTPFDGNLRIGRPGPQVTGPAPFLLTTSFRQDPRKVRSYQDIDAPEVKHAVEDEVFVLDYRTT